MAVFNGARKSGAAMTSILSGSDLRRDVSAQPALAADVSMEVFSSLLSGKAETDETEHPI